MCLIATKCVSVVGPRGPARETSSSLRQRKRRKKSEQKGASDANTSLSVCVKNTRVDVFILYGLVNSLSSSYNIVGKDYSTQNEIKWIGPILETSNVPFRPC